MRREDFDVYRCVLGGMRLIEASAGTGKTWTLCGLYLRLLLEKALPVQSILVVTFTNAATAELRERIRTRIAETLAHLRGSAPPSADPFVETLLGQLRSAAGLADEAMALRLDLALQSFDEAAIYTIHGFCQRALAEMPFTAGMPMATTLLADDSEMRLAVVQDFWRRRIASDALPGTLAEHLLDRKDSPDSLSRLLARVLAKPLARRLWPAALDATLDAAIAPPTDDALAAAFASAQATWARQRDEVIDTVHEAQPGLHKTHYAPEALAQSIASWDALCARGDALTSLAGLDKLDLLSAARLKPNQGKAAPRHQFFVQAEQLLALHAAREQALALQRLQLLRELLDHGPAALLSAKRAQRVVAFDDMLVNLYQRLLAPGGGALVQGLRQRFGAALIDEFQDTDPLQYAIFHTLFGDATTPLVLVGDPKQAIYSFRSADLHTYLRARREAAAAYTLAHNQRSSRALLAAQNALFGANPRAFVFDELPYHAVDFGDKARKAFVDRSAPPRAALQLWQLPRGADGLPLPKAQATHAALDACAGEIARLIGAARAGEITRGERALSAGDIAVLVRSHAHGTAMRRALARVGVGSVELSQASVFDSHEATELQRLLAAVLEPTRLPLLRAALATDLMGLDAAALLAASGDEALLLDCIERFTDYRDTWLQRGVGLMLRRWMRAEGVSRRLLAHADGERRLTNLTHLAELLHEAAAVHAAPEALLRWLQAQRSNAGADDAAQLRLESDRDLVQVVTIHKSKGLEYPVVFCPLLWDGHGGGSRGGDGVEYHDDNGAAVIDFRVLDKADKAAVDAQLRRERDAETMRLFYVALTRAVQRCYLVVGCYQRQHGRSWSSTESCHARLHWWAAGAGMTPEDWPKHKLDPEAIDAAWVTLAHAHAGAMTLQALPMTAATALAPQDPAPHRLAALAPPARIPRGWRIGSYSSLAHGARHDGAALDHDLRVPVDAAPQVSAALAADDILRFPRGAAAGECLHAVFERVEFGDATLWPAVVAEVLQRYATALPSNEASAPWDRMLLRLLHDVMHTPLPGGMRLAELPTHRRQAEMEFHLSAPHLDARALDALLRQTGRNMAPLAFGMLQGYLRGFIDLVFEHGGRYFVLDWKSNHLGDTPADYAEPALQRAMQQQGYALQALLYALALHRHLQQRLSGYEHERHFGGVLYLFVRGVRPAWLQADGSACGVHAQRPSLQTLDALSSLLCGGEAAA